MRAQRPRRRVEASFSGVLWPAVEDKPIRRFFVRNREPAGKKRATIRPAGHLRLRDEDTHAGLENLFRQFLLGCLGDHMTRNRKRIRPVLGGRDQIARRGKNPFEARRDPKGRIASPYFSRQ